MPVVEKRLFVCPNNNNNGDKKDNNNAPSPHRHHLCPQSIRQTVATCYIQTAATTGSIIIKQLRKVTINDKIKNCFNRSGVTGSSTCLCQIGTSCCASFWNICFFTPGAVLNRSRKREKALALLFVYADYTPVKRTI